MTRHLLLVIALACSLLASTLVTTAVPSLQIPETDAVKATVDANSSFAADLYQVLLKDYADKNLFLSPYSISAILGLTAAGARGTTADQMQKTLHISNIQTMQIGDSSISRQLADTQGGLRPYQLSVANAIWEDQRYPMVSEFKALAAKYYGANGAFPVDFLSHPDAERLRINKWVEDQTNARIKDLLPPNSIDMWTALVLTNAIYFKGSWQDPFRPNTTRIQPFHVGGGKDVQVSLMSNGGSRMYFENDDFQMISLPYTAVRGSAPQMTSMLIILPRRVDGLAAVEKSITAQNLRQWISAMERHTGQVLLPKFTITTPINMNDTLKAMGMTDAFQFGKADFRGLATPPQGDNIFIGGVYHKAFVDLNEEGTEAAAATAVALAGGGAPPANPFMFRADHPFFFAIRYEPTNSILFMGHVIEPPQAAGARASIASPQSSR